MSQDHRHVPAFAPLWVACIAALLTMIGLVLLPAPAQALVPLPDYNEPNDSYTAATALENGETAWGAVTEQTDKDYFYLDLASSGEVEVTFTTGTPGRECDLFFRAQGSSTTTELTWTRDHGDDGSFYTSGTAGPGRFFAVVSLGAAQVSTAAYTVTVTYTGGSGGGGGFPDVLAGSDFYPAITYVADEGVVSGYADGRFGPQDPVKRQQFAKMIVRACGYPVSTSDECRFVDVQTSYPGFYLDPMDTLYPDHYVAVAARHGITVGKTAYTFEPYSSITLAQVVTMVVRAGEDLGVYDSPPRSYTPPFDGFGEPHYAYAREGAAHGLFAGYPGPWDWHSPATRGQCAFFIWKLMLALHGGEPEPVF